MLCLDDLSVFVPSRGSAPMACRMVRERLPSATLVVAEEEVDDYLAEGISDSKVITHPNLYGLSRIRNFILNQSKTEVAIQVDDDMHSLVSNIGKRRRVIHDPDMLMHVFLSTANVANEAGANLFGFGNVARPLYVKPDRPFRLDMRVMGVSGTIGDQVKWDDELITVEDIDCTLRELELRRIVWVDMRYAFHFGAMFQNPGGAQQLRSSEQREADILRLEKKWGPYIDCRSKKTNKSKSGNDESVYKILAKRS